LAKGGRKMYRRSIPLPVQRDWGARHRVACASLGPILLDAERRAEFIPHAYLPFGLARLRVLLILQKRLAVRMTFPAFGAADPGGRVGGS
jgi:hypothetical protein